MKHGARSPALVEQTIAEIEAEIDEQLAALPFITPPDAGMVYDYKQLRAQIKRIDDYLRVNGGPTTPRAQLKRAAKDANSLRRQAAELAKLLGIGPVVRAGMARDMTSVGLGAVELEAARERMRKRLKVVN